MCVGAHVKGFYFSMFFFNTGGGHLSKNNTEMVRFHR